MKTIRINFSRMAQLALVSLLVLGTAAASAAEWAYVARPGDDLWKITERYLKDIRYVTQLQSHNGIADPSSVAPGTRIRIPVEWSKYTPAPALAVQVQGQVLYRTGETFQQLPLKAGTELGIGSEISTGSDGSMYLRFADGSELALKPNSTIKLDSMSAFGDSGMVDSRVRLLEGRLEFDIERKPEGESNFEVTTPAATTAVRGTRFRISMSASDATSRTEVTRGKVAVSGAGAEVALPEKFGTLVREGQAPLRPVPLLSGPDLSALPTEVDRAAFHIAWPASDMAAGYRAQIAASEGFETTVFDRTSSRSRIGISGLPDGDYHIRIRAIDKLALEGLDAAAAFTLDARPEPPVITNPLPGAVVAKQDVLLRWTVVENAGTYHVQVARDRSFGDIVASAENLDTPAFSPGPLENGPYFWRIAMTDDTGERGPFSPPIPFIVEPAAPSTEAEPARMTFAWAGTPDFRYVFQLARDPDFELVLVNRVLDEPRLDMEKLVGGRYFLRIATIDDAGYQSPFGSTAHVDVPLL